MINIKDIFLIGTIVCGSFSLVLVFLALKKAFVYAFARTPDAPPVLASTGRSTTSLAKIPILKIVRPVIFAPRIAETDPFLFKLEYNFDEVDNDYMLALMGLANCSYIVSDSLPSLID